MIKITVKKRQENPRDRKFLNIVVYYETIQGELNRKHIKVSV